jgi:hypothetical protein
MALGVTVELVELADMDELVRHIDRLCTAEDWDEVVELRDLCRKALERGRQLWPVASQAEYRLALEAPARWAAQVLVPGTGRFALGPLPEVAASSHRWDELAPHVVAGPEAAMAAHERVVRGEDLREEARVDLKVLDIPPALESWEPTYPVAEYSVDEAAFPLPVASGLKETRLSAPGEIVDDPYAVDALLELARTWVSESNGRAEARAVRGDALAAIAALGPGGARVAELDVAGALARMAWTAASGGAHGRRRGMAAGRYDAWWALAAVAGLSAEWPVPPDDLADATADLRWYLWDPGGPDTGWTCRIAVEDRSEGLAWALSAVDAAVA